MSERYILGLDQSTSATKAMLFNNSGGLVCREDISHRQIVDDRGWVEHDLLEIYENCIEVIKQVILKSGIDKSQIIGIGISNQRETAAVWDRETGVPVYNAIVWQCSRGEEICKEIESAGFAEKIREITGLPLSPYFSAAKIAWVLKNIDTKDKQLCAGTIDSWLIYKLTGNYKTDYSNASRTQLFDLKTLTWSDEVCQIFGIDRDILAEVCDSDCCFGYTDVAGLFDKPIPIHGVMGDSHGALFGQGCHDVGMMKTTYGTGSSIMMNIGSKMLLSDRGAVTSIAWKSEGKVDYVLEGNINYTGAVITWLAHNLDIIETPEESAKYAAAANPEDETYLVPAFSGLGAPYWKSDARAILCNMSRTTGKNEVVRAALECIVYQISDVVGAMRETANITANSLRVDGGPTKNSYLMQFQSDILNLPVEVPEQEELSCIGPSYMAGIALGLYDKETVFTRIKRTLYSPAMDSKGREKKLSGWSKAIGMLLGGG
ncbi:MAG: glycerol kinase GlpK [Oscillospiraceae bacterium]|nr:glycerol kinase GlpK [Oscillospiraceae bacterium]